MNKFFSSLYIVNRDFPQAHQVFQPRYNKEYFKRVSANIDNLATHVRKRCKNFQSVFKDHDLKSFQDNSKKLIKLRERIEKLEKKSDSSHESEIEDCRVKLGRLEELLIPTAVLIPNRYSKNVPEEEVVLDSISSGYASKEKLTKVFSHTKLSYINNCYQKSVVGPNSHYYYGIAAKLQHALDEFFTSHLEKYDFIPVSGLCLTKSALVEGTNSEELKDYFTDPGRILSRKENFTTLHVVEASREALVGFMTTLAPRASNDPLRIMASGASYRCGSSWFDADDKRITQFQTVHALIHNSSIEQYSMKEYHNFVGFLWDVYKLMKLPTRLVHCSLDTMISNEYDAHRIDVWLPSRQEWIQVGRVAHYLDYITIRIGMKRGHLIDSTVYDGQAMVAAIMENNQTTTGKFIVPSVLKEHMIHLAESEKEDYFRQASKHQGNTEDSLPPKQTSQVLFNYEQRRYLVKRNYAFGHSQKAYKNHTIRRTKERWIPIFGIAGLASIVSWGEVYQMYAPKPVKRFLYDKVYRKIRAVWWYMVYSKGVEKPDDLCYDELDQTELIKDPLLIRKEFMYQFFPAIEKKPIDDDD